MILHGDLEPTEEADPKPCDVSQCSHCRTTWQPPVTDATRTLWMPASDPARAGAACRAGPPITLEPPSTARYQREERLSLVIPLVIPPHITRQDGAVSAGRSIRSDKLDTLRDGMDGCGSTSNPYGAG